MRLLSLSFVRRWSTHTHDVAWRTPSNTAFSHTSSASWTITPTKPLPLFGKSEALRNRIAAPSNDISSSNTSRGVLVKLVMTRWMLRRLSESVYIMDACNILPWAAAEPDSGHPGRAEVEPLSLHFESKSGPKSHTMSHQAAPWWRFAPFGRPFHSKSK